MPSEFPIKNRESVITCNLRYWRCEAYTCPVFTYCSAGNIKSISDYEVKLLFEED